MNIDYDIFRPANLENWEASLKMFYKKLAIIEEDTKYVIDQCIGELRSTELGVKLLENVNNINTRGCLINHIQTKYDGIVKKFFCELEIVEHEFQVGKSYVFSHFIQLSQSVYQLQANKMKPPLMKNQPNFIGAVLWKQLLLEYVTRSANAFRKVWDFYIY